MNVQYSSEPELMHCLYDGMPDLYVYLYCIAQGYVYMHYGMPYTLHHRRQPWRGLGHSRAA